MDQNALIAAFDSIWAHILTARQITIVTHIEPDGDTIGSAVALKQLILSNTTDKPVKIVGQKPPRFLMFLDETEVVDDTYFYDSLVIVVDTSTITRFADQRVNPLTSIKIDHHHLEESWLVEIGGDHWPAAGEVVFEMATHLKLIMTERAKEALFVAIWTDTDGMVNRNISPRTHEIIAQLQHAKHQALKHMALLPHESLHIDELVAQVSIKGNVAYLVTDALVPNDYSRQLVAKILQVVSSEVIFCATWAEKQSVRLSFRSRGNVDVSTIAKRFGGGGHFSSSGARTKTFAHAHEILDYVLNTINATAS